MLAYNGSIPGPTLRVRAGLRGHGQRRQRRRPRGDRALARAPARQPLRRHARDAGADPRRRTLHLPRRRSPTRASTGTTRTSARTTARRWASTGTSSSSRPSPSYWPPAHRELSLTLDDVLLEDGQVAPFSRDETTYAAMGRFGNVMLVGGRDRPRARRAARARSSASTSPTPRTRASSTSPLPGARMKLVGGDSGRYEREELVESVILAPSERAVVDVLFERGRDGDARAPHARPDLRAGDDRRRRRAGGAGARRGVRRLRHERGVGSRAGAARRRTLDAPPDKTLALVAEMDLGEPERPGRLRLPDAPGGRQRRAGQLPGVRHEAARARRRPRATSARCTRRSSATSPTAARSAA